MPSKDSAMLDQMMEPFDADLKDEARRKKAREKKKTQRLTKKLTKPLDANGESTLGPKKKVIKEPKEKKGRAPKKVREPLSEEKEKLISDAYFVDGKPGGYQNKQRLLKDVKMVPGGKDITKEDIAEWHAKRFVPKQNYKKYSSVAPEARYEYSVDLFEFKDPYRPGYESPTPYGLLVIDSFSKLCAVEPLTDKKAISWVTVFQKAFHTLGGKPKVVYSDPDASMDSQRMSSYLRSQGIEWIRTKQHASIAERAIRTIKQKLYQKLEHQNLSLGRNVDWTKLLPEVLDTYNKHDSHRATGMTPTEAAKEKNDFNVRTNLIIHSRRDRVYPELKEKDKVYVYNQKKFHDKQWKGVWSDTEQKIHSVKQAHGQQLYKLHPYGHWHIRADLLKLHPSQQRPPEPLRPAYSRAAPAPAHSRAV